MHLLPKSRRFWTATIMVAVIAAAVGWPAAARPRGMLMARIDHARGHYEVQVHGERSLTEVQRAEDLLLERYGVRTNSASGCLVTWESAQYAGGYNSVSRRRLVAKHGKDIFAECDSLAQAEGDAAGGPR
jgi:hypothetical protein